MNGRIHMTGMVFFGHHGDIAEERVLGQRFVVDLVLTLDIAEVARTDELSSTVDYVGIYTICQQVVENEPVKLLETLACRLAEKILANHARVNRVDVVVKKPSVPLRGALDYVAIEISQAREDFLPRARQ